MKRNVNVIDYIRVIATLLVFMLHTLLFTNRIMGTGSVVVFKRYFLLYTPAWAGVWIFLIISGYLSGNAFLNNKYELNRNGIILFWTSKIIKLLIPTLLFALFYCMMYPKFITENSGILVRLLTFRYKGIPSSDGLSATWYISTIMKIFLIAPLAIYMIERILKKNRETISWILWLGVVVAGLLVRLMLYKDAADWNSKVYTSSLTNLDLFFSGILINYLPKTNKKKTKTVIMWIIFIIMIIINCFVYSKETSVSYFVYQYIFPSVYAIIVTLLIYYSLDFTVTKTNANIYIINRITLWLSNISFQFYLWHSLVLSIVSDIITAGDVLGTHIKLLGIGFFLSTIISAFLTSVSNKILKPLYDKMVKIINC